MMSFSRNILLQRRFKRVLELMKCDYMKYVSALNVQGDC